MRARDLLLLLVLFSITPGLAIADEIPAIRPTKASGAGENRDAALKDALRSAVEAGVGIYLDTASIVKNTDLISDKILTHSQGYVESYQIVKETPGSIYRIEIVAQVKSLLIKQSLQNERLLPFEGSNVYANAVTNLDRQSSAKQLIAELLADYPNGSFIFSEAKPNIRTERGKLFLDFSGVSATWQEGKLKHLIVVLDQVASTKERAEKLNSYRFGCQQADEDRAGAYITAPIGEIFYCYKVDLDVYEEFQAAENRLGLSGPWTDVWLQGDRNPHHGYRGITDIGVLLKDANGAAIYEKSIETEIWSEQLAGPEKRVPGNPRIMISVFQKIEFKPFSVEVDLDRVKRAHAIEIKFMNCTNTWLSTPQGTTSPCEGKESEHRRRSHPRSIQ